MRHELRHEFSCFVFVFACGVCVPMPVQQCFTYHYSSVVVGTWHGRFWSPFVYFFVRCLFRQKMFPFFWHKPFLTKKSVGQRVTGVTAP